ncbi:MAG: hypothetical protein JKY80_09305 [Mariprofundaceae bacterium]|nr:hypothetical protein [Mariprofundaceae bacterium]
MPVKHWLTLSKFKPFSAILLAMMMNSAQTNDANALTGGEILSKLDTKAQTHYVSGILQGLGYARFLKDKSDLEGAKCIQAWLLKDGVARWQIVKQWLEHHKDKPAGVIIYTMVSKECGK